MLGIGLITVAGVKAAKLSGHGLDPKLEHTTLLFGYFAVIIGGFIVVATSPI